jgi:hypothetical protein
MNAAHGPQHAYARSLDTLGVLLALGWSSTRHSE